MECNAFCFFCRSIRNAEQGLNESRLMLTACFFNRLVMKCFCTTKKKRMVWVEAAAQRAAYLQEHLFVLPINI